VRSRQRLTRSSHVFSSGEGAAPRLKRDNSLLSRQVLRSPSTRAASANAASICSGGAVISQTVPIRYRALVTGAAKRVVAVSALSAAIRNLIALRSSRDDVDRESTLRQATPRRRRPSPPKTNGRT